MVISLMSCKKNSEISGLPRPATLTNLAPQNDNLSIIYLSADAGKTWRPFADGLPADATVSSFLSTEKKVIATTEFHGVYVYEGGTSWRPIHTGLPADIRIKAIEVINSVWVIGTSNYGIFTSADEGKIWIQSTSSFKSNPARCLLAVEDLLLLGSDKGIFQSTDEGKTWQHVFGMNQITGFSRLNDKVYAGVMNGALMTPDKGKTWKYIYQPRTLHDISNDGKYIYAMTLGEGLLQSDDDGATWRNANTGLGTSNLYTFEVKNLGSDLFAGQWTGIFHSNNEGRSWQLLQGGLPDSTAFTTLEITDYGIMAGIGLRK